MSNDHGCDFELKCDFDLGWLGITNCICTGYVNQKIGEPANIDFFTVYMYFESNKIDVTHLLTDEAYDLLEASCLVRVCGLASEKGKNLQ